MYFRPFAAPLAAIVLLSGAAGCSHKEDVSPAPSTGSFELDGTAFNGQAQTTTGAGSIGGTFYDFLNLDLTPNKGPEAVERIQLLLYKVPGAPASSYLLHHVLVYTGGNGSPYYFAATNFTLTPAGEGSFSGSFAARNSVPSSAIPGPYTTLTNGVFTAVKF